MHPLSFSLIVLLSLQVPTSFASRDTFPNCNQNFSCGNLTNIYYPFSGGKRPDYCGRPGFHLTCVNNSTTLITINSLTYRVIELNQLSLTLLLSRDDLFDTIYSFFPETSKPGNLFTCEINGRKDAYSLIGPVPRDSILSQFHCSADISVPIQSDFVSALQSNTSLLSVVLKEGFNVSYSNPFNEDCSKCYHSGGECGFDSSAERFLCICDNDRPCPEEAVGAYSRILLIIGVTTTAATIIVASLGCYYCFTRKGGIWKKLQHVNGNALKQDQNVKAFISNCHSLMPRRYSYSSIKRMTNSFSDKLGQGGFGGVYRGKLSDGRHVAVKLLKESIGNGEEFINEVASISRTSHVNVVSLLGFCYETTKRALVYEYMPNGSLDKFIFHDHEGSKLRRLEQKTLFEIAIGIARGLEYLHRGCSTRIVHFDIKPHNILLDEDFCPKIADFGLAKLCKGKGSIVSMLGARGTAGYIAPEVFMRGYGRVSYKSDVYSYGMMILEMFAGKKIVNNGEMETNSETYFPDFVYENLERRVIDENMKDGEEETVRRFIIVGLWCIQTNPIERPSMTKVIEMLEADSVEFLQIPPKPLLFSSTNPTQFLSSSVYLQSEIDEDGTFPLQEADASFIVL